MRFFGPPAKTFGYVKTPIDPRDHKVADLGLTLTEAAPSVSLRHPAVTPRSQAPNQSCVGHALAQGIELAYAQRGTLTGDLSARAPYFWSRATSGILPLDQGCEARAAMNALIRFGLPTESSCPTTGALINSAPSWRAHQEARDIGRGLRRYARIDPDDLAAVRLCLSSKVPVWGGWEVDQAFVDYAGGATVEPATGAIRGGHAMLLTGYYSNGDFDLFNQSWVNWGESGSSYARVSERFVSACLDLWALQVH